MLRPGKACSPYRPPKGQGLPDRKLKIKLQAMTGVEVDDISPINTSFPTFTGLLAEATAR